MLDKNSIRFRIQFQVADISKMITLQPTEINGKQWYVHHTHARTVAKAIQTFLFALNLTEEDITEIEVDYVD